VRSQAPSRMPYICVLAVPNSWHSVAIPHSFTYHHSKSLEVTMGQKMETNKPVDLEVANVQGNIYPHRGDISTKVSEI
jgi:hypothetical protein